MHARVVICMRCMRCTHQVIAGVLCSIDLDMHRQTFEPDHKQSNTFFANWKLSKALSISEHTVSLAGHVRTSDHSTDYINTRAAVLHNHINCQNGRMYLFCTLAGSLVLQQICLSQLSTVQPAWGRWFWFMIWPYPHHCVQTFSMQCRTFASCTECLCLPTHGW